VELCLGSRIRKVGVEGDSVAFHDLLELRTNVTGLDEVTFREVVVQCPLVVINICGESKHEVSRDRGVGDGAHFADTGCMR